jgi:hypothetical protein
MSSSPAARPQKRYTPADLEAELARAAQATKQTCQELRDELQDDFDILQNLEDYPANDRARVVAATRRAIQVIVAQLRQQHCPE